MRKSFMLLLCLAFCACQSKPPAVTTQADGKSGGTAAAGAASASSAGSSAAGVVNAASEQPQGSGKNSGTDNSPVLFPVKIDGQYGYIDGKGKLVLKAIYAGATRFTEGLAAVQLQKAGRAGFIDSTGNMVIPVQFDLADPFSEGLAAVMVNHKWGFVDKTGQIVIPTMYDNVSRFSEGTSSVAGVVGPSVGYTFINRKGESVLDKNIRFEMAYPFSEGLAAVRTLGQGIRFIDHSGKTVIPPQFTGASEFGSGLAPVQLRSPEGMRWEYIAKDGKQAFPTYFYNAFPFTEGLAAVQVNTGKWGFVDPKGKMVIPAKFDSAGAFYKGLSQVYMGQALGYIDTTGKYVWEPRS